MSARINMPAAGPARGFTLLELLAALAVFALMSVMAYGSLNALIRSNDDLAVTYDELQTWQMAVERLRQDIGQVRNRPVRDPFGDFQPALIEAEEGRLIFTRGGRRNPLFLPRSTLERVGYFLDSKGRLVRESWQSLDRAQSETPIQIPLLSNIETLQWRYLDSRNEWQEDWPPVEQSQRPATQQSLPRAVELQIDSRDWGELRFLFATGPEA